MNVFVFDIETIPDIEGGRKLYNLDGLTPKDIAQAMFTMRRQETGHSDFLRLHLHRVVAISVLLRSKDQIKLWSLGEPDSSEKELLERFFMGLDKFTPTLVSWNGGGFDLPVIHYRSLIHGVAAPRYWETGDGDQEFRWNNYLNRYHYRHLDLMDVLASYQPRANAPMDDIATLIGLPGKMGMSGAKVWDYFQCGEIEAIRNYCETDVLNTYLIYLRFELMRGKLMHSEYYNECQRVREMLERENKAHLSEFLTAWSNANQ